MAITDTANGGGGGKGQTARGQQSLLWNVEVLHYSYVLSNSFIEVLASCYYTIQMY